MFCLLLLQFPDRTGRFQFNQLIPFLPSRQTKSKYVNTKSKYGVKESKYGVKSFPVTRKPVTRIETYAEDHM